MRVSVVAAIAGLLLLAVSGARAAEKITWDWAIYGPPRAYSAGMEYMAKTIAEKTNGNFIIKLHYAESIAPAKEVLDSLKIGAIQGAATAFSYAPGKTPLQQVLDLPWLPIPTLDAQIQVHEAFHKHPPVDKELARWNATVHSILILPQYEFMGTAAPPRSAEDWKGRRVRALGGMGDAMRMLGAVPTSVPAPEVYSALERGVFEAASFPFSYGFGTYRLHEVSKWYTRGLQLGIVHNALTLNRTEYEKLPAEYRQLLDEVKAENYRVLKEAYAKEDEKWLPIFRQLGLQEVTITPEALAEIKEKAAKPVWEKWVADTEAKGLPGQEILDFVLAEAKKAGAV